ncbi:phosphatase PAP2 family protein [Candidatus Daviesbacteria bacterium]|nr:phosphatase PAP2 family protein [Candidatus Daviesbacteria bacterium]
MLNKAKQSLQIIRAIQEQYQDFIHLGLAAYIVILVIFMLANNISITPDRLVIFLLLGAVATGRVFSFLKNWAPFVLLLLSYEALRGFAWNIGLERVHASDIIEFEKTVLGNIYTVPLQAALYQPGQVAWYDVAAAIFYFLHFAFPFAFAFWFWLKDLSRYWGYVTRLLVLSYAGWITYVIFPAMPPWLASQNQLLPPVHKIITETLDKLLINFNISQVYLAITPNPIAAVPSLHAAYAWLAMLFTFQFFKKSVGIFFIGYSVVLWFLLIYTGEHYLVDLILGAVYATITHLVVGRLLAPRLHRFRTIV